MSNTEKNYLDLSNLGASLPPAAAAAAALSAEDGAGLVNALKDNQNLAGQHSDVLEALTPNVRKRVKVLRELQSQHDEFKAKFFEERAAVEAKYQKLYEPLYTKRYEVVNGVVEVEGVTTDVTMDEENKEAEEKGVPSFWVTAMKTNEVLAKEISERDEEALKCLKDIKWYRIDSTRGFKLEFFFDTNPFFKNSVLAKIYRMIGDDLPVLVKAIGTEIEWYPGKSLTQKIVMKKPKVIKKKPKKGSKDVTPIRKTKNCDSFFNFFNPPPTPGYYDYIDEKLRNQIEQDYDIGLIIQDKIIPHAVSWFTGEAVEADEFEDIEEDDDEGKEEKYKTKMVTKDDEPRPLLQSKLFLVGLKGIPYLGEGHNTVAEYKRYHKRFVNRVFGRELASELKIVRSYDEFLNVFVVEVEDTVALTWHDRFTQQEKVEFVMDLKQK